MVIERHMGIVPACACAPGDCTSSLCKGGGSRRRPKLTMRVADNNAIVKLWVDTGWCLPEPDETELDDDGNPVRRHMSLPGPEKIGLWTRYKTMDTRMPLDAEYGPWGCPLWTGFAEYRMVDGVFQALLRGTEDVAWQLLEAMHADLLSAMKIPQESR